ncbi:MAG: hypothetical protein E6F95_01450 [Actinobacteria bacterium]|nr:MAG: hypothetical protein E6F95_01450 [Actinomycetota bacterium]
MWTINADGTDLTRLTHSPAFEFDPSWSPDGTQIAYRSDRGDESEIWVMNADGTDQRRPTAGLSPAWSPDGSSIAFASPGHDPNPPLSGISIMNADGSGQHRVPNTDGGEYPSWSPDGERIAFNSNLTGDHVMYVVNVDGSGLVDLSRDNYTDLYVMRPDGSDVKRLTEAGAYTPAWAPDGSHIVFCAPGLFVMRADGTGIEALPVDGIGETTLPDWRGGDRSGRGRG